MKALCTEICMEAPKYRNDQVVSVFVGGGTPSVVEPEWIRAVFRCLRDFYDLAPECEITIEVNPGTVTEEKLLVYRSCGINRLSIGLQSAVDSELVGLGRIHTYEDFQKTYELAVKTGFNNINVDVMSAIPGQTLASYQRTLQSVIGLKPMPQHISAYSLIVEEGTPFYGAKLDLPDEDTEREMYRITDEILERAGYHRYEISNYAKNGFECFHNKVYWTRGNYVGFGIGSASLVDECRFQNTSDRESYVNHYETIKNWEDNLTSLPEIKCEIRHLSEEEQMEEFMFLGLRMMDGVSEQVFYDCFRKRFREVFPGIIRKYEEMGLLITERINGTDFVKVRLSARGIDVSNVVMADFLLTC